MRVVVDTNISVSAFWSPGRTAFLILEELWTNAYELAMSAEVLAEIEDVRGRSKLAKVLNDQRSMLLQLLLALRNHAVFVHDIPDVPMLESDPKDTKFLALAIAANVDYIVSGDKHLLQLGAYQNIPILSPRQFLELLESAEAG